MQAYRALVSPADPDLAWMDDAAQACDRHMRILAGQIHGENAHPKIVAQGQLRIRELEGRIKDVLSPTLKICAFKFSAAFFYSMT